MLEILGITLQKFSRSGNKAPRISAHLSKCTISRVTAMLATSCIANGVG
jgi:hypothetical protein